MPVFRRLAATTAEKGGPALRIAIASDHAGFNLKQLLLTRLAGEPDLSFIDLGTSAATPPVDYPDFAKSAATAVVHGDADRGIVICGSGAGACIAASKVRGTRAFLASETYTAHQAVEHDDANIAALNNIKQPVQIGKFTVGRHASNSSSFSNKTGSAS